MIKLPEPQGPVAFKGPYRRKYSVEQFALAYNLAESKVVELIERGFLGAVHRGRREEQTGSYVIRELDRLRMEKWFGEPSNPKTKLPL